MIHRDLAAILADIERTSEYETALQLIAKGKLYVGEIVQEKMKGWTFDR
jgi:hypothetical protein